MRVSQTGPNVPEGCHVTTCHNTMSKDISGTRLGGSDRCESQTWQLATKLVYQLLLSGIRCNQAVPFPMPVRTLSYSTWYLYQVYIAKDTLYTTWYRVHVLYSPMRKGEARWHCTMYGRQVQLYRKLPVLAHCVAL